MNFEDAGIDNIDEYVTLPSGTYTVVLAKDEEFESKKTGMKFLKLVFDIIEGEFKGLGFEIILNLWHSKAQVAAIAKRQLKNLAIACNRPNAKCTEELQNIPIVVVVKTQNHDQYGESYNVQKFESAKNARPAPVAQKPKAKQPAKPAVRESDDTIADDIVSDGMVTYDDDDIPF